MITFVYIFSICLLVFISHSPFIQTTAALLIVNIAVLFGSRCFLICVKDKKA